MHIRQIPTSHTFLLFTDAIKASFAERFSAVELFSPVFPSFIKRIQSTRIIVSNTADTINADFVYGKNAVVAVPNVIPSVQPTMVTPIIGPIFSGANQPPMIFDILIFRNVIPKPDSTIAVYIAR